MTSSLRNNRMFFLAGHARKRLASAPRSPPLPLAIDFCWLARWHAGTDRVWNCAISAKSQPYTQCVLPVTAVRMCGFAASKERGLDYDFLPLC